MHCAGPEVQHEERSLEASSLDSCERISHSWERIGHCGFPVPDPDQILMLARFRLVSDILPPGRLVQRDVCYVRSD